MALTLRPSRSIQRRDVPVAYRNGAVDSLLEAIQIVGDLLHVGSGGGEFLMSPLVERETAMFPRPYNRCLVLTVICGRA
jgi:hypothetical protein